MFLKYHKKTQNIEEQISKITIYLEEKKLIKEDKKTERIGRKKWHSYGQENEKGHMENLNLNCKKRYRRRARIG